MAVECHDTGCDLYADDAHLYAANSGEFDAVVTALKVITSDSSPEATRLASYVLHEARVPKSVPWGRNFPETLSPPKDDPRIPPHLLEPPPF